VEFIGQTLIFLKFDFVKTYDKMSWEFLFISMEAMGMATRFINVLRLLFKNAKMNQW
jgi:hypothetical protein